MDFTALNKPIGYSKAPLQYGRSALTYTNTDNDHPVEEGQIKNFDFTNLPIDIIEKVIGNLSQFDLLNMCRTSSRMYRICRPGLYHCIIIDPSFNIFAHELRTAGVTYIKSSYNLKVFLKILNKNPDYSNEIYSLSCKGLPGAFFWDNLIKDFIPVFKNLHHLHNLIWLDYNFPIQLLNQLPKKHLITTLILRFEYTIPVINTHTNHTSLSFPNLSNFQIQHFRSSPILQQVVDLVSLNVSGGGKVNDKLRVLSLDFMELGGSMDIFQMVFERSALKHLPNLTSLSLFDIRVRPEDADTLSKAINLSNLQFFLVRGFVSTLEDSFLSRLASRFQRLRHLSLNISGERGDATADFVSSLPQLESLDIVSGTQSSVELAQAIAKHHCLTKLSSEIYDIPLEMVVDYLYDPPSEFYSVLSSLNLTSLRINNTTNMNGLVELITSQKQLKFLEILGAKAGGAPNLGLGMVHPTVFDKWFRVQHVALFYLNINPGIEYIRVNDCVFECKDNKTVNPRDGLNGWFNEKVKTKSIREGM
ncbi:hypothetical protein KGF57_005196 [Candida theae]|uniref:F-box domain-containing protein n=1 Tax=Candida theae TaxID=1198502 RepID=A0AAD5B9D5_9ASCO|nr:uncharacterized protein KGF57_005196 [Candida theae]KAI5948798.1 hypothetical protein KGF57_005196 [Candida theae]